jgi:C1A family cysteine protease
VDLSASVNGPPWSPPFDQGSLGSCGPNAASGDIIFDLLTRGVQSCPTPSRLFIYYCARTIMGTVQSDSGVNNRDLLKALNKYGWCDESMWPYDIAKFRTQPPTACFTQAAARKIVEYKAVSQDLTTMRACLAGGDTFIFGFTVYESFESQQVAQTGIVPMPGMNERKLGGHDVLFVGYNMGSSMYGDIPPGCFKFKNSWSGNWGRGGFGFMPIAYGTSRQLSGDFWTVVHAEFPVPTPPGPPPIPPTPTPASGRMVLTLDGVTTTYDLTKV